MCHVRPGSSRLFVDDISNQRVIIFEGAADESSFARWKKSLTVTCVKMRDW
jgi:hypothetical protein